jgi:hypothetical protein
MSVSKFFLALLTVVIYEVFMVLIPIEGLSLLKLVITLLIWISFYLSISTFIQLYQSVKENIPHFALSIFFALVCWNIINVFRGALSEDSITTIWGNKGTSLALLIPFSLAFGLSETNLRTINRFFIGLIIIGAPAYLLFYVLSGETENIVYNQAFQILFSGSVFLIMLTPLETGGNKFVIFLGSVLLFYFAIKTEVRTMMLRILLLYSSLIALYFYSKFNFKWIIPLAFLTMFVPFILVQKSISSGQSAFDLYFSKFDYQDLTMDTRTFLYQEVYDDLRQNNRLLIGKGSNGRYYSPYFSEQEGDASIRLSMEVGIMALLLKGGYIAVFLNLFLILIAIYFAFFKSNNYLVMGLGFMLLVHLFLLFIQNFIEYSTYNLATWFFIGVCLSKKSRSLNNIEIRNILLNGNNKT